MEYTIANLTESVRHLNERKKRGTAYNTVETAQVTRENVGDNYDILSIEDFMKMEDEEVAAIVSSSPIGRVGTLVIDGSRRAAIIFYGMDPSRDSFDKKFQSKVHPKVLNVIETFFHNGVTTMYLPLLSHETFDRGKPYMDAYLEYGVNTLFHDPLWVSFYEENNIKVKCYGDREYIKQRGFQIIVDWMEDIEEKTDSNDGGTIFAGIACSRSQEEVRLSSIGIGLYKELGRAPTRVELAKAYFGIDAPDVGFLVRTTELRDSDLQPVLTTGPQTQMYFPVVPFLLISKKAVRHLLYDLVVNRVVSKGVKIYSESDADKADTSKLKKYYEVNRDVILGVGTKQGSFWIPNAQVKMPVDPYTTKG